MIERFRAAVAAFRSSPENPRTSLSNPDAWLWDAFGASNDSSGVAVNERTSMRILAVYACVRIISETVASLPLLTYRRLTRGKERANTHPLYSLLHDQPNPEMTAMTFREVLQAHVLIWGNAWAEIEENKAGRVIGLWPLLPDRTHAARINGQRVVVTALPDGQQVTLPAAKVFHVPGLSFDGLNGYSPIQMAKNALGLTKAAEEFGSSFFGRGAQPAGILTHPNHLTPDAAKNLQKQFDATHSGLSNAHRTLVLEEAMDWKQLGMPNNHAQFLETRQFQLGEIARLFRVPPHMLADLKSGASYASVEQMSLDFVTYTLRPWLVRWEQGVKKDLLGAREAETVFVEHLVDGLLRGDLASRYAAYAVGRQWGWLSADDIRELENMNPLPDEQGSMYLVPLNMVPASDAGAEPEPIPAVEPPAEDVQRSAYRGLFREVGERMVRREVPQLRKLLKQGDAAWSQGVEAVYREHVDHFTRALQPAFDALLSFGPPGARRLAAASGGLASDLARRELTAARQALDAAGESGAEALLMTWERERPDAFAARAADFLLDLMSTPTKRVA